MKNFVFILLVFLWTHSAYSFGLKPLDTYDVFVLDDVEDIILNHDRRSPNGLPVVFFLPGAGGDIEQGRTWAKWFSKQGVASVLIDSAGIRGLKNLFDVNYGKDLARALLTVSSNPNLDLTRYAVMGFSKGGTAALESNKYLKNNQQIPDFIFSLYPGWGGKCPNRYKKENSSVFVFYGELDGVGSYRGTRDTCKRMASKYENTHYYGFDGVNHGYDGDWEGDWTCCGGKTFTNEHNSDALKRTQDIILENINRTWKVTN